MLRRLLDPDEWPDAFFHLLEACAPAQCIYPDTHDVADPLWLLSHVITSISHRLHVQELVLVKTGYSGN